MAVRVVGLRPTVDVCSYVTSSERECVPSSRDKSLWKGRGRRRSLDGKDDSYCWDRTGRAGVGGGGSPARLLVDEMNPRIWSVPSCFEDKWVGLLPGCYNVEPDTEAFSG